jgi:hypothetical protein
VWLRKPRNTRTPRNDQLRTTSIKYLREVKVKLQHSRPQHWKTVSFPTHIAVTLAPEKNLGYQMDRRGGGGVGEGTEKVCIYVSGNNGLRPCRESKYFVHPFARPCEPTEPPWLSTPGLFRGVPQTEIRKLPGKILIYPVRCTNCNTKTAYISPHVKKWYRQHEYYFYKNVTFVMNDKLNPGIKSNALQLSVISHINTRTV